MQSPRADVPDVGDFAPVAFWSCRIAIHLGSVLARTSALGRIAGFGAHPAVLSPGAQEAYFAHDARGALCGSPPAPETTVSYRPASSVSTKAIKWLAKAAVYLDLVYMRPSFTGFLGVRGPDGLPTPLSSLRFSALA